MRPPTSFSHLKKLRFGGSQSNVSMTIRARGVSNQNLYFNVNSQSIRLALSSLLDSSINRHWEVRLIKSFKAPFRSSRSRAMFQLKLQIYKNSVQPQQHETGLNRNNNQRVIKTRDKRPSKIASVGSFLLQVPCSDLFSIRWLVVRGQVEYPYRDSQLWAGYYHAWTFRKG